VKDLLPSAKVKATVRHGDHHLAAHHLPLQVGIGVILAGTVVLILAGRRVRGQPLQPFFVIGMEAPLIVVDKHTRSNVHRIYKGQHVISHVPLSFP
jgi:hypothetical protein